jgi:hypothetical protein
MSPFPVIITLHGLTALASPTEAAAFGNDGATFGGGGAAHVNTAPLRVSLNFKRN